MAYTFAVLFATFGIVYRYALWLQRPPTQLNWKRGWQVLVLRGHRLRNFGNWFRWVGSDFALNRIIFRRDLLRGLAHWLLMWGCVLAAAITFPLVFGWLSFESVPGQLEIYRVLVLGFPMMELPSGSWLAFLFFHGLVWSAFLITTGGCAW